jgi:hypothetical protein
MKPSEFDRNLAEPVESSGPRRSWHRLPTESRRAHSAFTLYLDSADRRLGTVAKALTPPCSAANVARWSSKHAWHERAADYDSYVDEQHRQEMARTRKQVRARRLQIAQAIEGLTAHAIKQWQTRIAQGLPLDVSLETIAILGKAVVQLQETALGPEREHEKYATIQVILGDAPPLDEPATITRPALCDDTRGEVDGDDTDGHLLTN